VRIGFYRVNLPLRKAGRKQDDFGPTICKLAVTAFEEPRFVRRSGEMQMKPEDAWLRDFGERYTAAWAEGGELGGGDGKLETRKQKVEKGRSGDRQMRARCIVPLQRQGRRERKKEGRAKARPYECKSGGALSGWLHCPLGSVVGGSKPAQRERQLWRNFSRSSGVIRSQRSSIRCRTRSSIRRRIWERGAP
jgi:hypothetical protein